MGSGTSRFHFGFDSCRFEGFKFSVKLCTEILLKLFFKGLPASTPTATATKTPGCGRWCGIVWVRRWDVELWGCQHGSLIYRRRSWSMLMVVGNTERSKALAEYLNFGWLPRPLTMNRTVVFYSVIFGYPLWYIRRRSPL